MDQQEAKLLDIGPAIRDGLRDGAKMIKGAVDDVRADMRLAETARIDGWIQGGLITAIVLIVLFLFFRK